jgi:hypothetical protein
VYEEKRIVPDFMKTVSPGGLCLIGGIWGGTWRYIELYMNQNLIFKDKNKRRSSGEERRAHNPEVEGSKPFAATFIETIFHFYIFL